MTSPLLRPVAALYVDPRGPYPAMPEVDAWDEERDAKLYAGPFPVVAHPPCGPWGRLKRLSRYQDPECALRAVEQVRRWGGVLEHPEASGLWPACSLPSVVDDFDQWGGFSVVVEQVAWGHVARKRTWLYVVGVAREAVMATMLHGGEPTHVVTCGRNDDSSKRGRGGRRLLYCSPQQRRRTPPAFAEWLVAIARASTAVR